MTVLSALAGLECMANFTAWPERVVCRSRFLRKRLRCWMTTLALCGLWVIIANRKLWKMHYWITMISTGSSNRKSTSA